MANKVYAVNRIEGSIALCECLQTGVRISVDVKHLPPSTIQGDIIRQEGDRFILDQTQAEDRR